LELLIRDFSLATKRLPATLVKPGQHPLPPWAAASRQQQQQQQQQGGAPPLQQQEVEALVKKHNAGWLQRFQRRLQQDGQMQPFLNQINVPGAWNITTGRIAHCGGMPCIQLTALLLHLLGNPYTFSHSLSCLRRVHGQHQHEQYLPRSTVIHLVPVQAGLEQHDWETDTHLRMYVYIYVC
jgi:hypothetical protein